MKAMILLGAPGSGKGTVAEDLSQSAEFLHISTGDLLREAIRLGTPEGLEARKYMDRGQLVPDELITAIVNERVRKESPGTVFMFDGFPRTARQAALLDGLMDEAGGRVTHAFLLEVARETTLKRIEGRRVCQGCGAVYNIHTDPPESGNRCRTCGGEVVQREDDDEATVLNRLDVYAEKIAGLVDYYTQRGILVRVDAEDRQATEDSIKEHLRSERARS